MSNITLSSNGSTEDTLLSENGTSRHMGGKSAGERSEEEPDNRSTDGEQNGEHAALDVMSTYRNLPSRRVDLVGDYAGDELFLIEGDSMLLRCFSDDKLDFEQGFQLLHAVYNVEQFLHHLIQRKCNFKIVFFDCNSHLCVPEATDRAQTTKYLFARAAIIRHLLLSLPKSHPHISVDVFSSWTTPEFAQHLHETSAYFVMAHDGAQSNNKSTKVAPVDSGSGSGVTDTQRIALRTMILSLVERGSNIALINELQWRDTKVMAVVLESQYRSSINGLSGVAHSQAAELPTSDVSDQLQKIKTQIPGLDERQVLAIVVTSIMLRDPPEEVTASIWVTLCHNFLLHQALLTQLPLSARRYAVVVANEPEKTFISSVASLSTKILNHASWANELADGNGSSGIADYIDGRLFLYVCRRSVQIGHEAKELLKQLQTAVEALTDGSAFGIIGEQPQSNGVEKESSDITIPSKRHIVQSTVLPFSNYVFDKHLESVRIDTDASAAEKQSFTSRKVFKEVTHWHNAKRPLIQKGPPIPEDARKVKKAATRNQRFMAEMQKYAASLTNAVGRSLEPETIISGQIKSNAGASDADSSASDITDGRRKPASKKGGGAKTDAKNATKNAMFAKQAADKAKKATKDEDKQFSAWEIVRKDIDIAVDPRVRYRKAQIYLGNLQPALRDVIGTECELYMINCLVSYWYQIYRNEEQSQHLYIAALVWNHLQSISSRSQLTKSSTKYVKSIIDAMDLPVILQAQETSVDRKLPFSLDLPAKTKLNITVSDKDFQLMHCGPYLERSFDSKPDARVDFRPDDWQRRVLDAIDADRSVFVVAPTSAGKTFISFYAMRKVLEADDESVLVYVAPTKALVNQIAAEIQGRYSKSFKHGGKSVWAIHTRDYRINNPTGCQILVTVPHVLQIMLLAPTNAKSWSHRIKRIIFDEIHSIGQAEDGVVWEQLLLMAPSPIIALSATVGNPNEFAQWLASTQGSIGHELVTIGHPYRYSDLRKYYYVPPEKFSFGGVSQKSPLNDLSLDGLPGLNYIHPVAALVDRSRGIPDDLALEPQDCSYLWQSMKRVGGGRFPVPDRLDPEKCLPSISRKKDILMWEKSLKQQLQSWLEDPASPFDDLLHDLERDFRNEEQEKEYKTAPDVKGDSGDVQDVHDLISSTLPLLCRLHERDALPAIFFNYDRHLCEKTCRALLDQLVAAEAVQVKSGPKWEKKLERWEEWKDLKEKAVLKGAKANQKKPNKKAKDESDDADKASKLDLQRESASAGDDKWERFDPDAPEEGYHFADHTKLLASELAEYVKELEYREIPSWLVQALGRGIGVHHSGMNRKYRQVVEILFRKRFLRVIVATGTLALGINMPCKTVVFSGDSVFLTALNYRQCAGRAGRRGFDLLGNVVFQNISRQKVCRLISSRLPSLTGHFPITTSFVLRLFTLLHESSYSKYAVTAINSVLSQPRLYMGGESFKDQTMHHLRFSIEYLRRQHLLGSDGVPLNFAGLVSHLYYTENSSFAFHALLKEGFFNDLCANINTDEINTKETLMLVMCHLFNRVFFRHSDMEALENKTKKSSSMIFLPPLPEAASSILREHNQQTLEVYTTYVQTFVDQHVSDEDNILPLTNTKCGGQHDVDSKHVRSAFVALSGLDDRFESIHDLCSTVRSGVFLEEAVIPYMQIYPEDGGVPLNAWLLDFFKHGDVATLERDNGIRRSDVWFYLNDFSLVLATIVTSLINFMKLGPGGDSDMLDLQGGMDVFEEAREEEAGKYMDGGEAKIDPSQTAVKADAVKKVKARGKALESWEDAIEEPEVTADTIKADKEEERLAAELSVFNVEEDGGLRNVLKSFQKLQVEFNEKFRAMWA